MIKHSKGFSRLITRNDGTFAISIYPDDPLTPERYKKGEKFLKARFENMKNPLFSAMTFDALSGAGMSNDRFDEAVRYVIANVVYKEINPAHLLQYDKVLELKTNMQIMEMAKDFGNSIWDYYDAVDVGGICMFCEKGKMEQFGIILPKWKAKPHKPVPAPTLEESEKLAKDFHFTDAFKKTEAKPVKKSKYQGKWLSADEIEAEAEKRAKEKEDNSPL